MIVLKCRTLGGFKMGALCGLGSLVGTFLAHITQSMLNVSSIAGRGRLASRWALCEVMIVFVLYKCAH